MCLLTSPKSSTELSTNRIKDCTICFTSYCNQEVLGIVIMSMRSIWLSHVSIHGFLLTSDWINYANLMRSIVSLTICETRQSTQCMRQNITVVVQLRCTKMQASHKNLDTSGLHLNREYAETQRTSGTILDYVGMTYDLLRYNNC